MYYQMFRPTRYRFLDSQEIKIEHNIVLCIHWYNFKNLQLAKLKRLNDSRFKHI